MISSVYSPERVLHLRQVWAEIQLSLRGLKVQAELFDSLAHRVVMPVEVDLAILILGSPHSTRHGLECLIRHHGWDFTFALYFLEDLSF